MVQKARIQQKIYASKKRRKISEHHHERERRVGMIGGVIEREIIGVNRVFVILGVHI